MTKAIGEITHLRTPKHAPPRQTLVTEDIDMSHTRGRRSCSAVERGSWLWLRMREGVPVPVQYSFRVGRGGFVELIRGLRTELWTIGDNVWFDLVTRVTRPIISAQCE